MNRLFYDPLGGPSGAGGNGEIPKADLDTLKDIALERKIHFFGNVLNLDSTNFIKGYLECLKDNYRGHLSPSPGLRWVKASERLPEKCNDVIIRVIGKPVEVAVGCVADSEEEWAVDGCSWFYYDTEWLDESPSLPGEQDLKADNLVWLEDKLQERIESLQAKQASDQADALQKVEMGGGLFYLHQVLNWIDDYYAQGPASVRAQASPLDQQPQTQPAGEMRWRDVNKEPPPEGGRYWCYCEEINSLGMSHFQWNCSYSPTEKTFSDNLQTIKVTHWMPLADVPSRPSAQTDPQDQDGSASYKKWLDQPGMERGEQVEGKGKPRVKCICDEEIGDCKGDCQYPDCQPPSVEADQQVPRQSIGDVCGNIPVSEAFKIAKWADAEMESLVQSVENWEGKYHKAEIEIECLKADAEAYKKAAALMGEEVNTLRSSGQIALSEYKRDMEIVKGERDGLKVERDEYKKGLEDLNTELDDIWNTPAISSKVADWVIKRICYAQQKTLATLNKFTNNTKDSNHG